MLAAVKCDYFVTPKRFALGRARYATVTLGVLGSGACSDFQRSAGWGGGFMQALKICNEPALRR
jgi:hypothetical protein